MHEKYWHPGCGLLDDLFALVFKTAFLQNVIAYPDFKQIAEDKHRICWRGLHIVLPCGKGSWLANLKV